VRPEPRVRPVEARAVSETAAPVEETTVVSTEGGLAVSFREGSGTMGAPEGVRPPPVVAAPPPPPEIDRRGLIRTYLSRVQRAIGRPTYPRVAQRARLEGTVLVGITIAPDGRVTQVRVRRSSGHDALDRAAVDGLGQVREVPAPPAELEWRTREITLPIAYRIQG
jgi:TonB family protein